MSAPLTTEVVGSGEVVALRPAWDALVHEQPDLTQGLDATCGPVWFQALARAFPQAAAARIVVLRRGREVVGLLPLVEERRRLGASVLIPATELYGGRNGFLLAEPDPELLAALLRGIGKAFRPWQSLRTMLVTGSPSERLLATVAPRLGLRVATGAGWEAPSFPLGSSAAEFNTGVSKSLKQTLRTATNKLRAQGALRVVDIADLAADDTAIETVLSIERGSWKHEAGTAISRRPGQERFYRALFPLARQAGMLAGQVLYLDDLPIAYNFGVVRDGVYTCLKHSNLHSHQPASPAQVLNQTLIDALRAAGVSVYDFSGKSEPHKLRWSPLTTQYERQSRQIFNSTLSGWLGHAERRLREQIRHPLAVRSEGGSHDD